MKVNEFLRSVFEATEIKNNDLEAALQASGLKEVEIPDEVTKKFNDFYMTPDRAMNDPDINKKLKTKHWGYFADTVEKEFKAIVALLPEDIKTKYYAIPADQTNGIYERLKILQEGVSHINTNGSTDEVKKVKETHRKEVEALNEAIKREKEERENQVQAFEKTKKDIALDFALKQKVSGFKLAADFDKPKIKDVIINSTIESLKNGYKLDFDKDNQTILFRNKEDGDVYEGNVKVTLEKFLEKELEPYTVKNNSGAPAPSAPSAPSYQMPSDKPKTLQDMIKAGTTVN
jgi:gas vesicle protein